MSLESVDDVPDFEAETITAVLRHGELNMLGQVRHASNATLVCEATLDSHVMRCVYKPVRGEAPLWDFPTGTLAGREVASYEVSKVLGWDAIPTTVMRTGPYGPGMVQRWVDTVDPATAPAPRLELVDLCPAAEVPEGFKRIVAADDDNGERVILVHADDPRLQRLAVLDVIINNADRKGGHVLEGTGGAIYGIDHGICLHDEDKLRTVLWGWAAEPVPNHLIEDLGHLGEVLTDPASALTTTLRELISPIEIIALRERISGLIDNPRMPTPDRSRPIPWPAF